MPGLMERQFPGLPKDIYPIPMVTKRVNKKFKKSESRLKCNITQFPLSCAKACAFYKLQGRTVEGDLFLHNLSARDVDVVAAYSAPTRVRMLKNLYVAEALKEKVCCRWKYTLQSQIYAQRRKTKV
eukprot:Nk52_evm10s745 gene=Nk52_evmTU10s745